MLKTYQYDFLKAVRLSGAAKRVMGLVAPSPTRLGVLKSYEKISW